MAGRSLAVRNPRTGKPDLEIEVADRTAVAAKAARLRAGQRKWAAMPPEERVKVMGRWAQVIASKYRQAIIDADSHDTGYCEISRIAPDMMLGVIGGLCASAPAQLKGALREGVARANPDIRFTSILKPYGLVGIISPWNAPTMLSMLHAIPPLFAGCAVLLKPSEVTPRFTGPLFDSVREVPELAEVFDCVLGDGETGQALIQEADYISFTGSVPNGRKVAAACGERMIPYDVELGGKDPLIVMKGADIDRAVSATIRGAISATGQVCFSIERIYVDRQIHDEYVAALVERAKKIELNHPDPLGGHIGPFTGPHQAGIVRGHLEDALAKGATIAEGGLPFQIDGGDYMRPTVLTGVTHEMKIMREETFGPCMPVMAYDDIEEAIRLANDTDYGLSAAVIGPDEESAMAVGERIDAGKVSIQDAFLTFFGSEAKNDSFGFSGLPGLRPDLTRYVRKQALLINSGEPVCLTRQAVSAVDQAIG
ncbi:aldehyde dehydrogenase family protein [Erythrobacter sp. SG61-1L]|uniref:aldehyde dehydrogenase family protein n=1 Tax=Erythrobacter sp. SG61-1L TaxID=1603897 RepID=UPI0006C9250E|nr:aldehyde dehydrogenase family protein [Erythrobacter sp. SG61-1L]